MIWMMYSYVPKEKEIDEPSFEELVGFSKWLEYRLWIYLYDWKMKCLLEYKWIEVKIVLLQLRIVDYFNIKNKLVK